MSRVNIYFSKDFEEEEKFLNSKNNKSLYIADLIRRDMQGENNINKSDVEFIKKNISNILDILHNSDTIPKTTQHEYTQHDSNDTIIDNSDSITDSEPSELLLFSYMRAK